MDVFNTKKPPRGEESPEFEELNVLPGLKALFKELDKLPAPEKPRGIPELTITLDYREIVTILAGLGLYLECDIESPHVEYVYDLSSRLGIRPLPDWEIDELCERLCERIKSPRHAEWVRNRRIDEG